MLRLLLIGFLSLNACDQLSRLLHSNRGPYSLKPDARQVGQEVRAHGVVDTHIHLFDKTRPEGAPYPRDMPGGGEPPQGMIALPNRYQAITAPFGVVGAIVVEASPRLDDNQWILDVAADAPIIVGLVGRIDLADQDFG